MRDIENGTGRADDREHKPMAVGEMWPRFDRFGADGGEVVAELAGHCQGS